MEKDNSKKLTTYQKWYKLMFDLTTPKVAPDFGLTLEQAWEKGVKYKDNLPNVALIKDDEEREVVAGLILAWETFITSGEHLLEMRKEDASKLENMIKNADSEITKERMFLAMTAAEERRAIFNN